MWFSWLKHYMPRGLYGRAALILLLPVVVVQLVVTVVFTQRHFEDVTKQMATPSRASCAWCWTWLKTPRMSAAIRCGDAAGRSAGHCRCPGRARPRCRCTTSRRCGTIFPGRVIVRTVLSACPRLSGHRSGERRRVDCLCRTRIGPVAEIHSTGARISAANPHQLFVYTVFFGVLMTIDRVFLSAQPAAARSNGWRAPPRRSGGGGMCPIRPLVPSKCAQRAMPLSICATGSSGRSSSAR